MYFKLVFYKKYIIKNMIIVGGVDIELSNEFEVRYINDASFIKC